MTVYNWMCLLGIPSLFAGLIGFIRVQLKANKAMRLAVQAMLRDRLLQGYKYYLEKGWADLDDRVNMKNVWKQYHALGGNGDMNDLRHTFRHLPIAKGGPETVISEDD